MAEKKGIFGGLFSKKEKADVVEENKETTTTTGTENNGMEREPLEITQAVIDNARLTLLELLKTMQMEVDVVAREAENNVIKLEITGTEDLGLIIGKEGATLNALQVLLYFILSKKYQKKVYIHLDANDYKAKQEQAIIAAAEDAADVASKENVQIVLDPMNAAERRLVHLTLQQRKGIETFSRGEGKLRQVVVSPKGFQVNNGNGNAG